MCHHSNKCLLIIDKLAFLLYCMLIGGFITLAVLQKWYEDYNTVIKFQSSYVYYAV
jgi:hypothetical protein